MSGCDSRTLEARRRVLSASNREFMARQRSTPAVSKTASPPLAWVPSRVFFVSGVGVHAQERVAFQHAMRAAGVADSNLVKVSSVIAPGCQIIPAAEGRSLLRPGNIVHAVVGTAKTDEPHQRVTTALAWAKPARRGVPGYIAEIEEDMAKGKSEKSAMEQVAAEVLEILAMRLRVKVDAERLWSRRGRSRTVRMGGTDVQVGALCASAVGPEERDGEKLTAAVFVAAIYI
ncbi:MAG: pyruvoyl-dependent arginine decarboxylase [Gemmatimonadaceae bacterium]